LVKRTDESEPDNYFEITEPGKYFIRLSLKNMTVNYQMSKFDVLYIVGNGCDAGWTHPFTTPMEQNKDSLHLFTYLGDLKVDNESEIKIVAGTDWSHPTFRPLTNGAPIENGPVVLTTSPDDKWKVTASTAGRYLITLDVNAMEAKFEKQ